MKKPPVHIVLISILILFVIPQVLSANEESAEVSTEEFVAEGITKQPREDFFFAIIGEGSIYSYDSLAYGGGIILGYGTGSAVGIKIEGFFNQEGIDVLELNVFLRLYFLGSSAYSGPFVQFMGGTALINRSDDFSIPSFTGSVSAGLGFGWRFLFKDRWFLEPGARAGYPFIVGAGVSAGFRL